MKRIEHMTGLSTIFSEDFHILNYGVGGHYDIHVDFFDLLEVSLLWAKFCKGHVHYSILNLIFIMFNRQKNMDPEPHHGDRIATALFYVSHRYIPLLNLLTFYVYRLQLLYLIFVIFVVCSFSS